MAHRFSIEVARSDDAARLSVLIQRVIRVSNSVDYGVEAAETTALNFSSERMVARLEKQHILMCLADGVLVGTASFREGYIKSLFVEPDWQGKGVGGLLLAAIEAYVLESGLAELFVHSSITAHDFYLAKGYQDISFIEHAVASVYDMSKRLG